MKSAAVFPGQGSQAVSMGSSLIEEFAVARAVFEEVDQALGQNLSGLIAGGPIEELTLTENAQPALMATSVAAVRVLEELSGKSFGDLFSYCAGHSLGEYSALAAAGALDLSSTAKLLKLRGQSMQQAVPVGEGAMAAILGPTVEEVQALIDASDDTGVCEVANDNAPGQVVISGRKARVEAVMEAAKAAGIKRCVALPVSAPFHCAMMAPAAEQMAAALAEANVTVPTVPVVQNVVVDAVTDPETLKKNLVMQVTGRVRWTETQQWLVGQGVTNLVELGAGKVLAGLMKRVDRTVIAAPLGDADSIRAFVEAL